MYLTYALKTAANLLFTLLTWILSPALALLTQSDGNLPRWLAWFQTEDNTLDAGWKVQGNYGDYLATGIAPTGVVLCWYRVCWLCRNPAYTFCVGPLGIPYDPTQWVIDELTQANGSLTLSRAHTKDGKYFCYTSAAGAKYGYKLWWAMDAGFNLLPAMPVGKNTGNRLPICFTPAL